VAWHLLVVAIVRDGILQSRHLLWRQLVEPADDATRTC
jgi:hypothetical protein